MFACTTEKQDGTGAVSSVEGLLYLDGKPVRIEIAEGKIASITAAEFKIRTSNALSWHPD